MARIIFGILGLLVAATAVIGYCWPPALWGLLLLALLAVLGVHDVLQEKRALWRNYPIVGHLRMILERQRGPIRQYFAESDTDGKPFGREQRSVVYARAKGEMDTLPFGTRHDLYAVGTEWIAHSMAPHEAPEVPPRVRIGGPECAHPYDASFLNMSAMSFGSLSPAAVRALNGGAAIGGFAQNTGEGGISPHHLELGGDLIWQIGTGYFGCRTLDGAFDAEQFAARASLPQVKAIEVKISQGAKPSHGGILPAVKVNEEIGRIRGVRPGVDCISPAWHSAFDSPRTMLLFLQQLRRCSGKPVGIKLCIGDWTDFFGIGKAMHETGLPIDFITVDGAEGGTGAAPLELTNSVGAPLTDGLLLVHDVLTGFNLRAKTRIIASGRIITGFDMVQRIAIGADLCNAARGFLFSIGCIQALACNRNTCPTGVATQNPHLVRGLVVADKQVRAANYHRATVHSLLEIVGVAGLEHPRDLRPWHIQRRVSPAEVQSYARLHAYVEPGDFLQEKIPRAYEWPMRLSSPDAFGPKRRQLVVVE